MASKLGAITLAGMAFVTSPAPAHDKIRQATAPVNVRPIHTVLPYQAVNEDGELVIVKCDMETDPVSGTARLTKDHSFRVPGLDGTAKIFERVGDTLIFTSKNPASSNLSIFQLAAPAGIGSHCTAKGCIPASPEVTAEYAARAEANTAQECINAQRRNAPDKAVPDAAANNVVLNDTLEPK
jgi:hypothetical protein